jgi:hypothetical protein
VNCVACRRSGKSTRLPHGWKRLGEAAYCETCWRERYYLRSIALPVVEPVGEDWTVFREALKDGWTEATAAANWMMTELYARDVRRNGEEKMPRMARVYLYPEARLRFPRLASQTVASIENHVQASYRMARYELIWTCSVSLPVHRFPLPLPVHNQSWEAATIADRPVVRVRLGERWWSLRLKGGPRFKTQTEAYRQIVSGEAVRGELALYRIRAKDGKLAARPNGDQKVKYTVIAKMVAWFPRSEPGRAHLATDSLKVVTATDALLVALNARDERVWRYHGDHLRRWVAEHRRMLGRLADDQKAEQRPAPAFADRRSAAAVKYRNRMSSAIREIAAQLVGYAARRGFGVLEYDDSVTGFFPEFPYAALRGQILNKCEAAGLQFDYANANPHEASFDSDRLNRFPGPPVGPARSTADTLAGLSARGRL